MYEFLTLNDFDFKSKKVLLRVDFNVPLDNKGRVIDDFRIRSALPTINYLIDKGAKIIILTHVGRPRGKIVENLRTNSVANRLRKFLNMDVVKLNECIGKDVRQSISKMEENKIIMLENVRFHPEEKDTNEKVRDKFAKKLASLADLYVNDAFGNCHRNHASMTNITKFLPSCAGLLVQKELKMLKIANKPKRPFVIVSGGAKADKINIIANLVRKADKILLSGALAFIFLKVKGYKCEFKADLEGFEFKEEKIKALLKTKKIILPKDVVLAEKFEEHAKSVIVKTSDIRGGFGLDIGPDTIKYYKKFLKNAKTILWFGPVGVFEWKRFSKGTREVAKFIANSNAITIVGGGDSAAVVAKLNLIDKMTHVSTGGGASLFFLEGKKLPAIEALKECKRRKRRKL